MRLPPFCNHDDFQKTHYVRDRSKITCSLHSYAAVCCLLTAIKACRNNRCDEPTSAVDQNDAAKEFENFGF